MRLKSKSESLLVSILLLVFILSSIPQVNVQDVVQAGTEQVLDDSIVAGTPHGPIVISGDGEFKTTAESESWAGDGIESSPYIIEGYDFDLGGTGGNCIEITDTTAYFTIRNCSFTGASGSGGRGIYLYNVTNCEIVENILNDNYSGLNIVADNATIADNDISELSVLGIGIYVSSMMNSLLSGNTIDGGYAGLILEGVDQCEVSNNTITDSVEVSMYLTFCDYITITDNELIGGTTWGLYLEFADNCTIIRNTFSGCGDGIFLSYSDDNTIKYCTLERNTNGLVFDVMGTSSSNVIEFCEIRDNVEQGVIIDGSSRSLCRWNIFQNNSFGAILDGGFETIIDYNYYDTYLAPDDDGNKVVDFPKIIPGSASNSDPHPLILFPEYPVWDASPVNQNIEFGDEFSYSLDIAPPIPIGEWTISDETHFLINSTGTIKDIDNLDLGTYPIDIVATNVYGLSLEDSFTVTVSDSVNPIFISQNQNKTFAHGEDIEIQLMAWDLSGIDSWDINDSENFSFSSISFAENGILTIVGLGNLAVGTYSLVITAYDSSENYVTATMTVTVTTSGDGASTGVTDFIVSNAGLIVGIVALIVGIFAFLNSRKSS